MKHKDGEPCSHPGCLNHVTHPCEGCGRIAGRSKKPTPQGVVAILVGSDGREIANATDFNDGSPAGFSKHEVQEMRAKEYLSMKVMRELSSPLLSDAIDLCDAARIMRRMCDNGCQVVVVSVGYEGE